MFDSFNTGYVMLLVGGQVCPGTGVIPKIGWSRLVLIASAEHSQTDCPQKCSTFPPVLDLRSRCFASVSEKSRAREEKNSLDYC